MLLAVKSSEQSQIYTACKISVILISLLFSLLFLSEISRNDKLLVLSQKNSTTISIDGKQKEILMGLITSPQTMHRLWAVENSWKRQVEKNEKIRMFYITGQLQIRKLDRYIYSQPSIIKSIERYLKSLKILGRTIELREPSSDMFVQLPGVAERMTHHITTKTLKMFEWMFHNHLKSYRWFMKLDDDVYLNADRLLKALDGLDGIDPDRDPVLIGRICRPGGNRKIMSGGAGYIMSRKLLELLGPHLNECLSTSTESTGEDVVISDCISKYLQAVQVKRVSLSGMHAHPPHDIQMWRGWDRGDEEVNFDTQMITIHSVSDLYMLQLHYLITKYQHAEE